MLPNCRESREVRIRSDDARVAAYVLTGYSETCGSSQTHRDLTLVSGNSEGSLLPPSGGLLGDPRPWTDP